VGLDERGAWLFHLRFTVLLIGVAAFLALVGYLPTRKLGGASAIQAMWYGCALNVLAASIGALPITIARLKLEKEKIVSAALGSLVLRMATALALAVGALLTLDLERKSFVLWFALAYVVLLPFDTAYATKLSNSIAQQDNE
jgi:hypothetical protein